MHREDQFIPELIVRNGPAALDYYKSVFGAEEVHRMMKPDSGKLIHGELTLDGHKFFVCDEFPASEGGTCKSPEMLGERVCALPSWLTMRMGLWGVR
jgi:PhnB protein